MLKKCLFLLLAMILMGCGPSGNGDGDDVAAGNVPVLNTREITPEEQDLVDAGAAFSFELFGTLVSRSEQKNIFISPLSISLVLGMMLNGAEGDTHDAIAQGLHLSDLSQEEINRNYQSLMQYLTDLDSTVTVDIANSLWYEQGFSIEDAFVTDSRTWFDTFVEEIDFSSPTAPGIINDWVSDTTNGLITDFIDKISPATVLYLINTLYFKGSWTDPFDPADTREEPFYRSDGSITTVRMMATKEYLDYVGSDMLQAVRLPYGGQAYAMTVLLPREDQDLDQLIAELTETRWNEICWSMQNTVLTLNMPRFELEYDVKDELKTVLDDLGMGVIFDPARADFSGMAADPLWIDEVFQNTYVRVDEEGTVAVAATGGSAGGSGPPKPDTMIVNRPYVVVIHDTKSGVVLFMGKIVDPPPIISQPPVAGALFDSGQKR